MMRNCGLERWAEVARELLAAPSGATAMMQLRRWLERVLEASTLEAVFADS